MLKELKDLDKLFKMCRKWGVLEINVDNVSIKFGDMPSEETKATDEEIPTEALSPDELIYYAVEGANS